MTGPEKNLPPEDLEFSAEENSADTETSNDLMDISVPETGNVFDFESREKVAPLPESEVKAEQKRQLHESIGLLNADIIKLNAEISRRANLINDVEKFVSNQEIIKQQRELNQALLDMRDDYEKLNKDLKTIEKDTKLQFFPGDGSFVKKVIRNQEAFDATEAAIKAADEKRIQIWRERRDAQGETIDIHGLIATNNELRHNIQNQFKVKISGDSFMTKRFVDGLHDQNREAQRIVLEKKKEIEEFQKQLAILEAFNT